MSIFRLAFVLAILFAHSLALYHKDVTQGSFDSLLDPAKANLLIEFYAPWCGHCQKLAPEYERLGETFASSEDVVIAQVDADKHKKLAKRFDIKGYPTLKWVPKGSSFENAEEPEGERTAEGLLKFINTKTGMSKSLKGDSSDNVATINAEEFKSLTSDDDVYAFIGFFAPWCGHCKALKPVWEQLAKLYADEPDVVVGSVDCDANKDLCSSQDVTGYPTLKMFTFGNPEKYEGGRTIVDLVKFVNSKTGLDLTEDGGVTETGGTISQISDYIKSYASAATDTERSSWVSKCKETVDILDARAVYNYKYYKKVFERVAERGMNYIEAERDRLSKVISSSSSLKPSQRRSFLRRINVLNLFRTDEKEDL